MTSDENQNLADKTEIPIPQGSYGIPSDIEAKTEEMMGPPPTDTSCIETDGSCQREKKAKRISTASSPVELSKFRVRIFSKRTAVIVTIFIIMLVPASIFLSKIKTPNVSQSSFLLYLQKQKTL